VRAISRFFLSLAIFLGVTYLLIYGLLLGIGDYLTPSDHLQKSDTIVVLSGGDDRTQWGIKLYQDGWAPKILFSGAALDKTGPSNAAAMRAEALQAGIPDSAIIIEPKATDTYENGTFSRPILDEIGAKKIILVTSPYHQRRAYEIFKEVYKGRNVTILNVPSGYSAWNAESWWQKGASFDITASELVKIIYAKWTGSYS
jgi:uncharacterized SAM-binding protein YcdF (DUF218 family)